MALERAAPAFWPRSSGNAHWVLSNYSYDIGRWSRSFGINVRADAWREYYEPMGYEDMCNATSQFTYPGQWAYYVWHFHYGPFECSCADYQARGYDWFACKHVISTVRFGK